MWENLSTYIFQKVQGFTCHYNMFFPQQDFGNFLLFFPHLWRLKTFEST